MDLQAPMIWEIREVGEGSGLHHEFALLRFRGLGFRDEYTPRL